MNKIFIIGNLTKDPDFSMTQQGVAYCKFSVAVNRTYAKNEVDFFDVTTWKKTAENCARFLTKGKKVCVIGEMCSRIYTANDNTQRKAWEINADQVEFLSAANSQDDNSEKAEEKPKGEKQESMFKQYNISKANMANMTLADEDKDDLPF